MNKLNTPPPAGLWKVDRSRYLTGLQQCMMKRYLQYHAGPTGYGWSGGSTRAQLVGITVHKMLARAATALWNPLQEENKLVSLRGAFLANQIDFYKDLGGDPFTGREQWALVEGIVWAWIHNILPQLREKYDLVASEQEFLATVGPVLQMSRPDLILRNKATGKLENHDFKTSSSQVSEQYVNSWLAALQMAIGCWVASESLGEPITTYYIHHLATGGRGYFKSKGLKSGEPRQYSNFCYANFQAPNPPISDVTTATFTGYWASKTPVWEAELVGKPKECSNSEWLVSAMMPPEVVVESFTLLGPYNPPAGLVEDYKLGMYQHENWWVDTLWKLYELEVEHGWASPVFQEALTKAIPRSYNCYSYNEECPMRRLCFRETGWQQPGEMFNVRTPHHAVELKEFKERTGGVFEMGDTSL